MNMPSSIHYHPEVLDVLLSKNFVSYGGAFLFRRILFNFLHKGFIDLTPGFLNIVFLKTSGANAIRANFNTHLEEKKQLEIREFPVNSQSLRRLRFPLKICSTCTCF